MVKHLPFASFHCTTQFQLGASCDTEWEYGPITYNFNSVRSSASHIDIIYLQYLHDWLASGHLCALVQPQFRVLAAGPPIAEEVAVAVVVQRHLGVVAESVDAEGPLLRWAVHERLVFAARAARVKLVALLNGVKTELFANL